MHAELLAGPIVSVIADAVSAALAISLHAGLGGPAARWRATRVGAKGRAVVAGTDSTLGERGAHLSRRRLSASGISNEGTEEVMKKTMQKFLKDESGASLIEYVLIAGLISIVGWATMQLIGTDLAGILTTTRGATNAANGG